MNIKHFKNWDNCDPNTNGEYFFIDFIAKDLQTCFDIGANRGEYARQILKINKKCKIYCFEPNPDLFKHLKKIRKVKPYSYAVGDRAGEIDFYINTKDDTQSSAYRQSSNTFKVKIKQISLDLFVKREYISYIDFIKIDTEGNELNVLKGAEKLIKANKIGIIQFEYGGTYKDAGVKLKDCFRLLSNKYILFFLNPHGLLPIKYSKKIETYRYSNWIAVSRKLYLNFNI